MRCRYAWVAMATLVGCTGPGLEPPGDDSPLNGFANNPGGGADGGVAARPPVAAPGSSTNNPTGGNGGVDNGDSKPPPTSGDMGGLDGPDEDQDGGIDPGASSFFEGVWAVEQPFHALYEVTLYQLHDDGRVSELTTTTLGAQQPDFVTGTIEHPDGVRCRLAGPWRSDAARTLTVEASCSDAMNREFTLEFPEGDEAEGLTPDVSLAGDARWEHAGFQWRWRKCAAVAGCVQAF